MKQVDMPKALERIYKEKQIYKDTAEQVKIKCTTIMYDGFIKDKSVKDIHRELYESTINNKKYNFRYMYENSVRLFNRIKNSVDKENAIGLVADMTGEKKSYIEAVAFLYLLYFKRLDGGNKVGKGINDNADKIESDGKDDMLTDTIRTARDDSLVFYLASEHEDSAKDHEPFQGAIYIDENWKQYTDNPKVEEYIKKHNIKTVQWVISSPVWFLTRPNCRHYFRTIETEEVLTSSVKQLINKYDMHRKVGERKGRQTLSHPRSASWYSQRQNIQAIIGKYKQRLGMHNAMYEKYKSDELRTMILKDKQLIKKWKEYFSKKFN